MRRSQGGTLRTLRMSRQERLFPAEPTVARPRPAPPAQTRGYPLWNHMTTMAGFDAGDRVVARAEGVRVWDEAGRCYLDGISGLWNVNCGYGHPCIVEAIRDQLDVLPYASLFGGRAHRPAIELAARLLDAGPITDGRVFFTASGGAAVDVALKLARRTHRLRGRGEPDAVIALRGSYHGTGLGSMLATGEDLDQASYGVDTAWVRHVGFDDASALTALAAMLGDHLAAIIVEPVLGTGAFVLPPAMVAALLRARMATGALLIVDEVTTGFGRTGPLFASPALGLSPDLLVLSKGLTGGYLPLAATVCSREVCDAFDGAGARFRHGETQGGNPLACAAGLATLELMLEPGFLSHGQALGEQLARQLTALCDDGLAAGHRGMGLMRAVQVRRSDGELVDDVQAITIVETARTEGLLVYPSPGGVGLLPPLVMTSEELAEAVDSLGRALGRVLV